MSRRKTEINSLCTDRINILIRREKITQKKLAELIHHTQQNVNRICKGHNSLTEETAREIIRCFPEYRIEWLLGFDDYMTKVDFWSNGIKAERSVQMGIHSLLQGAFIEISRHEHNNSVQDPSEIPFEDYELMEAQIRDFAKSLAWNYLHQESSNYWRLVKKNDEEIMEEETKGEYYG